MKSVASHRRPSLNGDDLREMFIVGTSWLEMHVPSINALNVFPVPDGDTGTNMLLTMREALSKAQLVPGNSACQVLLAMAQGALMGARGNSGVILSQILRGLARGIDDKEAFGGKELAQALEEAAQAAYKAVTRPVEGTMLTVIKDSAQAASKVQAVSGPLEILETTVAAARESVAKTPYLLDILREAGVVDAGGQGLYILLEGALKCLKGETLEEAPAVATSIARKEDVRIPASGTYSVSNVQHYGYCTEFFIQGKDMAIDNVRERMTQLGESVIVVGDEDSIKVHVHAFDPGIALSYGTSLGTLYRIKIDNIDEQHQEYVEKGGKGQRPLPIATVVVVNGDGLVEVFKSLGATRIVHGGPSMNPSIQELWRAVEEVPSGKVFLLPNDPNVILAAQQVKGLTSKELQVIPSRSIPQGIGALLAANPGADVASNAKAMSEASLRIQTGEITRASRSTNLYGFTVRKGQPIGLLEGVLVANGGSTSAVFKKLLSQMDVKEGSLVTIYYGQQGDSEKANGLAQWTRKSFQGTEVEVIFGGQPSYDYIISVE